MSVTTTTTVPTNGEPKTTDASEDLRQRLWWLKQHELETDVWGLVSGFWCQYAVRDLPPELWVEFAHRWLTEGVRPGYVGGGTLPFSPEA